MKKYAVGADIGGTTVKLGLFTTEGDLLEKWEIPTRTEDNGKNIFPDIAKSVGEVLEHKGLTIDDLEGVGLDVPDRFYLMAR
jgi:glucokinase